MHKKQWGVIGNNHYLSDASPVANKLQSGVYKILDDLKQGLYLEKSQDRFEFPYKIYNKDEKFVQRVVTTYNNTTGNLGILLNGIKGTGKTVTAELICNNLNLPVIIVTKPYPDLCNFINSIQEDIIIFFDEYEKIYSNKKEDGDILTIMDGVLSNSYRKVFILTTNQTYINDNLLQRPGRLRYFKSYGDLDITTIMEIVDDKLIHSQHKNAVIEFISQLELITIDIVKAVVEEVNIHEEPPNAFKEIFNVKSVNPVKNVYKIVQKEDGSIVEELIGASVKVVPAKIEKHHVDNGDELYVNGKYMGYLDEQVDDGIYRVQKRKDEDYETITYRIEDSKSNTHRVFRNTPFVL